MKKLLLAFGFWLFCQQGLQAGIVEVYIDYGGKKEPLGIETELKEGMTALELLQGVAEVKLKKVGEYLFVSSINGVKSHSKTMGWFYEVDGKSADKMASDNVLTEVKRVKWVFKTAHCE